jgi:hypothetical protein
MLQQNNIIKGGMTMKKDLGNQNAANLKRNWNDESLEISSTGYGYETALNEQTEEQGQNKTNPSCGGL